MLHKYYDMLWQSFPQDHLITLSRLCDLLPVDEGLVETIVSYSSSDMANKRILNAALSNLKSDTELLGFSALVQKLIENPEKAKMIENLRSGELLECKCILVSGIAGKNFLPRQSLYIDQIEGLLLTQLIHRYL